MSRATGRHGTRSGTSTGTWIMHVSRPACEIGSTVGPKDACAWFSRTGVGSQVTQRLGLFVHDFAGGEVLPSCPCFLDAALGKLSFNVRQGRHPRG